MAKRAPKGQGSPEGPSWRQLDQSEKLSVLINHYGTAENLSAATGISAKSLRAVFNRVDSDLSSPKLESAEYRAAFQHARHTMTDRLRRRVQASQRGEYEAPIIRTPTNVLEPVRAKVRAKYTDYHGVERTHEMRSHWISYRVEHLAEAQIFDIAARLFDTYMATGQFNVFRYEYIANAEVYAAESSAMGGGRRRRSFKDDSLAEQALENDVVLISSTILRIPEFMGDVSRFIDYIWDDWREKKAKGAIRITELYFSNMENMVKPMLKAQAALAKRKTRATRNGGKKGKGRGI